MVDQVHTAAEWGIQARRRLRRFEQQGHEFRVTSGTMRITIRVRTLTPDLKRQMEDALVDIPHDIRP